MSKRGLPQDPRVGMKPIAQELKFSTESVDHEVSLGAFERFLRSFIDVEVQVVNVHFSSWKDTLLPRRYSLFFLIAYDIEEYMCIRRWNTQMAP